MRTEVTVSINAEPSRVWEVMTDVEKWPEWTPSVTNLELLADGPLAKGSKVRIKQPKFPPVVWTVVDVQPGRRFAWENASPAMNSVGSHAVEQDGSGSVATLSVEQNGPLAVLLGWWLKGVTKKYIEMEAQGLKARAEAAVV